MGIYNIEKVKASLAKTRFITDRKKYIFARYDKKYIGELCSALGTIISPFAELIFDNNEVTFIAPYEVWKSLSLPIPPLKADHPLGLITCDVTEENPTGYLLHVLEVLSPNNIGVYVQGAYTTDHIFVHYDDLDKALNLLHQSFCS